MLDWLGALAATMLVTVPPTFNGGDLRIEPRPACAGADIEHGAPLAWPAILDETSRTQLSAMVFLALDRIDRDVGPQPKAPCPLASFRGDGSKWTVHSGQSGDPIRWAASPDKTYWFYLVPGPSPEAAAAWARTRSDAYKPALGATYLLLAGDTAEPETWVVNTYDSLPDVQRLSEDIVANIHKDTSIAYYDPDGAAVSLAFATESGVRADIYRPSKIGPNSMSSLNGADGRYFRPDAQHEQLILRNSDLACPLDIDNFKLEQVHILSAKDENLDLSCEYMYGDSLVWAWITHLPDVTNDRAYASARVRVEQGEFGVKRSRKYSRSPSLPGGAIWIDRNDLVRSMAFLRRGEFLIELSVRTTSDERDAAFDTFNALADRWTPVKTATPDAAPDAHP